MEQPNQTKHSAAAASSSIVPARPIAKTPKSRKTRKSGRKFWAIIGIVLLCLGAGFGGAWIFSETGLNGKQSIIENQTTIDAEGEIVASVAAKVGPSVVSILTQGKTVDDYYGTENTAGAGTGIILSADGYIITNKHVVPDGTTSVSVVLRDGTQFDDVTVVGRDPLNDIAFLKIPNVKNLTPANIGSSDDVKIGQKVIAIGNALGEYQNTVTSGIISGTGRTLTAEISDGSYETLTNLFQTDAAINPGNSGGPLVTYDGKVIAINTAIVEDAQGLGFAIPISEEAGMIENLLATGKLTRAYLGVQYVNLTPSLARELNLSQTSGAYINPSTRGAITPGSPAEMAGLKSGDIIVKVGDVTLGENHTLASQTGRLQPGDDVTLTIIRDGKTSTIRVTLAEYRE